MDIKKIIQLANHSAGGSDNFEESSVGSNGYGFVFSDYKEVDKYLKPGPSGGLCRLGTTRRAMNDYIRGIEKNFFEYDFGYNLKLIGAIKTLVPTLEIGGFENFFDVWVFVQTPDSKRFPINIYYGKGGLSVGAWYSEFIEAFGGKSVDKLFTNEFLSLINFEPHDFSEDDLEALSEAIELALRKVPVSDYEGIFEKDTGRSLMGVREGRPFLSLIESYIDDDFE